MHVPRKFSRHGDLRERGRGPQSNRRVRSLLCEAQLCILSLLHPKHGGRGGGRQLLSRERPDLFLPELLMSVAMMPPGAFPRARRLGPLIGSRARRATVAALGLAMSLAGCVTLPIPGGKWVNRDYRPQILVTYTADGEVTPGVQYSLVQEGSALAFFEQTGAGTGTVLESHWTDAAGDHFAIWATPIEPGDAVEVVVPLDRTQPAYRFVYPPGLYDVGNVNGLARPIPKMLIEASTQLRPVGSGQGVAPPPQ